MTVPSHGGGGARWRAAAAMVVGLATTVPAAGGGPTLRDLTARARLVVVGQVMSAASYDSGRFSVATLGVTRTLKGTAEGAQVLVVERHDVPPDPVLLRTGEHVVAFLIRAQRTSSLAAAVPPGTYFAPVDARFGVVASGSAEGVDEVTTLVGRLVETSGLADPAEHDTQLRLLAFDEIAARHPALVEDGVAALGRVPDLRATITPGERARLTAALRRTDLPDGVRIALIGAVATARLTALEGVLRTLPAPSADVLAATWDARRQLGSPPTVAELRTAATDGNAAVRAAAVRGWGKNDATGLVRIAAGLAIEDPDRGVRRAAIERLGTVGSPASLAALERVYVGPHPEDRPEALRAIRQVGGRPAADALARLAFEAPPEARRQAVAFLMMTVPPDDPLLARVRDKHPDAAVRELVEHGLPKGEH